MDNQVQPSDPLCLFCSSTIRPTRTGRACVASSQPSWRTPCCLEPICETCLARNPRLLYYNPCLMCLTGPGALKAQRKAPDGNFSVVEPNPDNQFVIADDNEGSDDSDDLRSHSTTYGNPSDPQQGGRGNGTRDPLDRFSSERSSAPGGTDRETETLHAQPTSPTSTPPKFTSEYYIKPKDTLRGIALALGVDARQLCAINKLPMATLTTSPQLLHTRVMLKLRPEAKVPSPPPSPATLRRNEVDRVGKRVQLVTKEPDYRVAKTYAALAEFEAEDPLTYGNKEKISCNPPSMTDRAVDAYCEDTLWEEEVKRRGGKAHIDGFPYFSEVQAKRP